MLLAPIYGFLESLMCLVRACYKDIKIYMFNYFINSFI